ncbi:MCE family protein [Mycolicibacterium alvei]|uniref:Mce family protein Mce3D n=1 Tax=Mycolicibacterium alvei TaxID=67081 RepID=A0A6N4UT11_9MYCO|nr:MCE family protein [Mycolicibacterium alvei]MCV7000773.1 MCE family protein [Mycolicibacterium alvei]BBX27003.1 Mce family protein Mce3D [Mycolicibacterium alvei]
MTARRARVGLATLLAVLVAAGIVVVTQTQERINRVNVVGYFANSNGIFPGDDVRVLGVPVGKIDTITPEATRVKIAFWYDAQYQVPADAKAVILSPSLVTSRAIQLTPAYTAGPTMADHAVVPEERTAVPVEWDDFRVQLERLTDTLQPTQPGGVSTLGGLINTSADNLRGQGANIRQTIIQMSQAFSALGDRSKNLFSTVKNISTVVTALQSSQDLLRQLNQNLAAVTGLLANDPNEIANAVRDIDSVVGELTAFVAANKETVGTTSDKLASVSTALNQSLDDIKQTLHIAPTAFQNFVNIYQPAQGALTGALAINQFSNPIEFLCGAIQAASRLGAEQSAKLCAQYLAPIIKNRQFNFPPLGQNVLVGAQARPNEITYSEDWMRPDYVPPQPPSTPPAPAPVATNPDNGLTGMMVPPGGGS